MIEREFDGDATCDDPLIEHDDDEGDWCLNCGRSWYSAVHDRFRRKE